MTKLADDLRSTHAERLNAFLHHPFFEAVEAGSVTSTERDRYLVNERRFVDQAVVIFAQILAKALDIGARRHIVSILDGLVTDQVALFDTIFAQLSLTTPARFPTEVSALCDGMTSIARDGSYAEGLAAMLVAEWTYAQVSLRLQKAELRDTTLRDWFALHTKPEFLDGARWLERELNIAASPSEATAIHAAFAKAIQLEIDFHTAALAR